MALCSVSLLGITTAADVERMPIRSSRCAEKRRLRHCAFKSALPPAQTRTSMKFTHLKSSENTRDVVRMESLQRL